MSNVTVDAALAHVAGVLGSSSYLDKEVFIIIPNIRLANEAATKKVKRPDQTRIRGINLMGHLQQKQYIHDFQTISAFSLDNEPGTQKFCALQPRGASEVDQIWALEHFDSESALAEHRASAPVEDMLVWLQNAKPNGTHPLPIPVPLQVMKGSFVRPAVKQVQNPFVVVAQIAFHPAMFSDFEAGIMEFGEKAQHVEDVLMFMPGRSGNEALIVMAYRTKQGFEEKGFVNERFGEGRQERMIERWEEHFFDLKAGYLFRS